MKSTNRTRERAALERQLDERDARLDAIKALQLTRQVLANISYNFPEVIAAASEASADVQSAISILEVRS